MPQQQMTEEQMAELQEKIKNMSPEELREFQKKQCVFCHIVAGKVQSKKVYEDEKCIGVLDINPANPGHILLLPKEHYTILPQVPEEELIHLFVIAKTLSNAALRGMQVHGTNIVVANGIAAGQKAQHFMIHIIPRKEEDGINFELPQKEIPEKELEKIKDQLIAKLGMMKKGTPSQEKQIEKVQELLKPKVVEAEFKEVKKEKKKEQKKETKKEVKEKKEESKKENIDLDDIAKVLGVK